MAEHGHVHSQKHYIKIWAILAVLAAISFAGPRIRDAFGSEDSTGWLIFVLTTAFGIAFVKAYMVIKNFMHLTVEKRYILYLFGAMLAFMVTFFAGTAPDVMLHKGQNWDNTAASDEVNRVLKEVEAEHGAGHSEGH